MCKPKQSRLTDLQLLILSKASQRKDHAIELPPNLKSGAAAKVVKKLIDGKLAKEVAAKPGMPVWRRDDESRSFALIITHAGFAALGIEPDTDAEASPAVRSADTVGRKRRKETPPRMRPKAEASAQKRPDREAAPRTGTKQALIVTLLQRQQGATVDDLVAPTHWLPHTTRAALTGLRKKGYEIAKDKGKSGKTVYRIRTEPDPSKEPAARVSSHRRSRGPSPVRTGTARASSVCATNSSQRAQPLPWITPAHETRSTEGAALRHLHPGLHRIRARAGVQFAR